MTSQQEKKYREILIAPLRECALYTPKFGHSSSGGYSLEEFQQLYGSDAFYKWLGLDNPLMYSAHKAAGGITSIYRQIGIGCERLVRAIFIDYLGLSEEEANWSYSVTGANGKSRTLYLDGRIEIENIRNADAKRRVSDWMNSISDSLALTPKVKNAISGVVFEVRQGYKSKDSKRQNADIANASNAYANGYIPCLMVMSAQIDDDIVVRYRTAKWEILQGYTVGDASVSTYQFFHNVIGFDLASFMTRNQKFFQKEINDILQQLMRAK
jgi:hypothetical protein